MRAMDAQALAGPLAGPPAGPVHISDLPVDVLLEVFSRVPAADLTLSAAGVCRAWQDLALEPAAWLGRKLQVAPRKHRPLGLAERRALRRAPALRALAVSLRRAQDLPDQLSKLLPACSQLRQLQLSLPCLAADMAADVRSHWPRLQELRVEACRLQDGALDQVGQMGHLRALQLATLQHDVWPQLSQLAHSGCPALRSLDVDALSAAPDAEGRDDPGPGQVVLELSDRLVNLRVGALVAASTPLLTAIGQCNSLESLHVEDCSSLTDDGLLRLAGLRLHSLTLCNAKHVSTAALLRFLQLSDLSMLRDLNLSGCLALTDRVLRLLAQRCSQVPKIVAEDCPNISGLILQSLDPTSLSTVAIFRTIAPCTVVAASVTLPASNCPPLGVA